MNKKILTFIVVFCLVPFFSLAEYPSTSIGVIDLDKILSESDAAMNAAEQIEEIASNIENEINESDQAIINEQNLLIESQAIMAPEAFETKRIDYENKVQKYNAERQAKLMKIDELIATSRNEVLLALKPILEEIANKKGITVLLEKRSVILNADKMDITDSVLKILNKEMPKLKVSRD
jgi:Skp family chaperone for outer membrane proteins